MESYYHTHENNNNNKNTTQIPDNNGNLHTLLLMNNPNLVTPTYDQPPPPQQQPFSSNNIHLLNQYARLSTTEHNNVTLYGYPQGEARDVSRSRQGLSLTLSSHNNGATQHETGGEGHVSVMGSKFLRVTQELLEEVVNVGDSIDTHNVLSNSSDDHSPKKGKGVGHAPSEERDKHGGGDGGGGVLLGTTERHEILMKKAKLTTMLDEAEQRYRQYNNQMQLVIESFESVAGMGSANTYTALALKTISKQFRCLKDAIQGQIREANKSLGEDEGGSGLSAGKIKGSRLKFIDHQIRQQRALQHLGMFQNHNAWRPQRGLPERSVSVLRAWLFEHFLHPYPKDSDKILLAKQTGLTRSQVSNWFINARVRLWKPMIEDMYNEELKEQEQNGSQENTSSKENNKNNGDDIGASNSDNIAETQDKPIKMLEQHNKFANSSSSFMSIPTNTVAAYNQNGYTHGGSLELEGISQGSPKRQRSNEVVNNGEVLIKFGNGGGMNFMGGGELESYPNNMGDIGRFETEDFSVPRFLQGNGGISLSLGLPPSCENNHSQHFNNMSFIAPNQNIHNQFRLGNDFVSLSTPPSHSSNAAFECIDIQNRKGFAAQLA